MLYVKIRSESLKVEGISGQKHIEVLVVLAGVKEGRSGVNLSRAMFD